jgi:hypothetical protein
MIRELSRVKLSLQEENAAKVGEVSAKTAELMSKEAELGCLSACRMSLAMPKAVLSL